MQQQHIDSNRTTWSSTATATQDQRSDAATAHGFERMILAVFEPARSRVDFANLVGSVGSIGEYIPVTGVTTRPQE